MRSVHFHASVAVTFWGICCWGGPAFGAEWVNKDGRTFSFPDEYVLGLAAGPPLVERPMEADFDDRGRLYVTESSGSNAPMTDQLRQKPHRVLRLEDTDGDGVFDARTVFADGMMFPEGCLWHEGSLYVAAPPHIWKLTDTDGDGVAERREVWFDGKTLTGCGNDLHGPYRGPDGLIYWCKGAFAEQTYDLPGHPGWRTRAAHVFRAKAGPNGPEGIEPVFTAGMDNPVALAWTAEGDLIVSGTFLQHPGGGRRDGLIHAVRGGVWGKDHDVLEDHPRTGGLMPPMTHLGPAAPAGLARYGNDLLCAQFNMRKVSRHELRPSGATWRTIDSDFLACDHPDFHPTDVLQAPDGSVLVIDTGGWFKLCCPSSQLAKPSAPGAIYRLRRKGGDVPMTPPGMAAGAEPLLSEKDMAGREAVLSASLASGTLHARRKAAEEIGRLRLKTAIPALFDALAAPEVDRFLFHAYSFALLEMADPESTRAGLGHAHAAARAASLYALEQTSGGKLAEGDVMPHFDAEDARLREAALWAAARHPEWVEGPAAWARSQLAKPDGGGEAFGQALAALKNHARLLELLGEELAAAQDNGARARILGVMAACPQKHPPTSWQAGVNAALAQRDPVLCAAALNVIEALGDRTAYGRELTALSLDARMETGVRLRAMAARDGGTLEAEAFSLALAHVRDPAWQTPATRALAGKTLNPAQLTALAEAFPEAGLGSRPLLLQCFAGQSDEGAGLALVTALTQAHALAAMPEGTRRELFSRFPRAVQEALSQALADAQPPDQAARLDELEKGLPAGEAARGQIVFQSAKAACATCHAIGYKGGHLGPDLSKIGAIRTRRDLLEAVVFPSASFVRSYEPVLLTRRDDSVAYGIITNESEAGITLATGAATPETTVARAEIKSLIPGSFSLMPQGLDQILTPQELTDLISFLEAQK